MSHKAGNYFKGPHDSHADKYLQVLQKPRFRRLVPAATDIYPFTLFPVQSRAKRISANFGQGSLVGAYRLPYVCGNGKVWK